MSCGNYRCPRCDDRLIHQVHRGANESSSMLGQFVRDNVTRLTTFCDSDLTQLHFRQGFAPEFRHFEHKLPGQTLHQGQRWVLDKYRHLIGLGIEDRLISRDSGVFLIESWPSFDTSWVTQVPLVPGDPTVLRTYRRHELIDFFHGPLEKNNPANGQARPAGSSDNKQGDYQ